MIAESEFNKTVGAKIREMRREKRLSQMDVSEFVGLPRASMSKVECGDQPVRLYELFLMAALFECTLYDLLPTATRPGAEPVEIELIVRRANAVHRITHSI